MVRREDQPIWPPQVEGELPCAITVQRVTPPWDSVHVPQRWCGSERGEAALEQPPMVHTPSFPTARVTTTNPLEFPVGPVQLDGDPLDANNPKGYYCDRQAR